MEDLSSEPWFDEMSGRDRVRHVVQLMDGPQSVQTIADEADVSRNTADSELERLEDDDWVVETTVDGKKGYDLNPVRLLFDEITTLIDTHTQEELRMELTECKEEAEALAADFDVSSLEELREQIATEDLSSEELREYRNAIATWEAIQTEIKLYKRALFLYEDVTQLSASSGDTAHLQT